ncbi:methyl-accepting chemotaxis protein [Brachyspira aalborgi]|uniref:Methyl-accepting chemotaxis protein n=1 Tax=Brachyspira aalborgi TaxID=29522 RepID=A0A5C8DAY2_9SPIR|nr:methyl-accepting chemotaxis protein [Brachyspira aalborgi]TXJ21222.1 methyl-accepting chemotaxis protein [Brachyspira aalborgi]
MKIKKSNRKKGLMNKFLVPFAVFLGIVVICMYIIYRPQYKRLFLNNINVKMKTAAEEVSKWTSSFYSEIDIIEAYTKSAINTNDMLIAFSNIVKSKPEIVNVYFGNNIPMNNEGGIFVNPRRHLLPANYDQTKRDWFIKSLNENKVYISEPYIAASSKELVVTFAKAIYTNNVLKGVVGIDISFEKISEIMQNQAEDKNTEINIIMTNGMYLTHKDKRNILNEQNNLFSNPLFSSWQNTVSSGNNLIEIKGKEWAGVQNIENVPWMISGHGTTSYFDSLMRKLIIVLIIVVVAFMSVETILVLVVVRPLSETLNRAINITEDMGKGDFNARFEKKLLDKKDQTGMLTKSIDDMQKNIGSVIYKIKQGIDVINNEINKISDGSANLSDRSNSQAAALEELASSIEALSSSLKETARSASEAKNMSEKAYSDTKSGVEAVIQTANNMKEISESSKKISDITKMIQSIAFQTNILALNAAVEAARAGEQGRGFAVVASEIRSLAQTVNDAASNITNIVEDTVNKIEVGNVSVTQSSELLSEIEKSVNEVSEVLTGIANSSIQEEDSIHQINQAVIELNNITQENSDMAQESAFSSKEVSDRTENMVEEISYFKFKNDKK